MTILRGAWSVATPPPFRYVPIDIPRLGESYIRVSFLSLCGDKSEAVKVWRVHVWSGEATAAVTEDHGENRVGYVG